MKTFYDLEREVFMRNDPVALELVRAALEAIEAEADRDLEGEGFARGYEEGLAGAASQADIDRLTSQNAVKLSLLMQLYSARALRKRFDRAMWQAKIERAIQ